MSGALVGVTLVSEILRRHSPTVATDSSARVDRCGRPDAASARSRPSSVDAS